MKKCESCRHYIYCQNRNKNGICEGYKGKLCKSCGRYPFCEESRGPKYVCDNFKIRKGE